MKRKTIWIPTTDPPILILLAHGTQQSNDLLLKLSPAGREIGLALIGKRTTPRGREAARELRKIIDTWRLIETYDPKKRAAEKAASRAEDQRQLDAGEITREELAKRNGSFAFPRDQVKLKYPKKEK